MRILRGAILFLAALFVARVAFAQQGTPFAANGLSSMIEVTNAATGTTGQVTATLPTSTSETTYICGFSVSVAGLISTSQQVQIKNLVSAQTFTYQVPPNIATGDGFVRDTFNPCIAANQQNQTIPVVVSANPGATAVDVNAYGYQVQTQ